MPVFKYKTHEEAEQHLDELLPSNPLKRLARLHEINDAIRPPSKIEKGVFYFKTIQEANEHRENAKNNTH